MSDYTTGLKLCSKCGRELPADEIHFYRRKGVFFSPCKECQGGHFGFSRRTPIPTREGYRVCTKCGLELELSPDNFYKNGGKRTGFNSECKACHDKKSVEWNRAHREKHREYNKRWKQDNLEKVKENKRKWTKANPDKIREMNRRNIERNREKRYQSTELWRRGNPEKIRESTRRWRLKNTEKMRVNDNNRKARKRSLPDTLTKKEWQYAVDYFNGCCAVCGRQANDLFGTHTLAADHWIPLTSPNCPGTVAINIVPLCHSREVGAGGCNGSKHNSDPVVWLQNKYPKKWRKILTRIENYFERVRGRG